MLPRTPAIAAIFLLSMACATTSTEGGTTSAATPSSGGGFSTPPAATSGGGREIPVSLVVQYGDNTIGKDAVHLRSYNGKLVGPTMRARPGDTLNIHLSNRLPPNPPTPNNLQVQAAELAREMTRNVPPLLTTNIPHNFNTTNLHTHGLHVSPSGNSDNVLIAIAPGEDFQYEIKIPIDHPAGTFWYHPHVHGSTALQVGSGMEGALIIEGGLDDVPAIAAMKEQIVLFQQIPYAKQDNAVVREEKKGQIESFNRSFLNGAWERGGWSTTINGQQLPTYDFAPGEVQRFRFIDAGAEEALRVKFEGADGKAIPQQLIARDGIATGRIDPVEVLELFPGYRADVLLRAPDQEGEYLLVDDEASPLKSLLGIQESKKPLAKIRVSGARKEMKLPEAAELAPLAPYKPIADSEVTGKQSVHFGISAKSLYPFALDGRGFDPSAAPRKLTLGKVDEWTVSSEVIGPHIFHIHINPFEVIEADGTRTWRDTVFVPAGKKLTLRTRYERYIGKFVIHCHILPHEDLGMMEVVEIEPPTAAHAHSHP